MSVMPILKPARATRAFTEEFDQLVDFFALVEEKTDAGQPIPWWSSDVKVVVDGSNYAYHRAGGKKTASLDRVLSVLLEIKSQLSPVEMLVFVDASFRHTISPEEKVVFQELLEDGLFVQAPAGSAADPHILTYAHKRGAFVASNDNFRDRRELVAGLPLVKATVVDTTGSVTLPREAQLALPKAARDLGLKAGLYSGTVEEIHLLTRYYWLKKQVEPLQSVFSDWKKYVQAEAAVGKMSRILEEMDELDQELSEELAKGGEK